MTTRKIALLLALGALAAFVLVPGVAHATPKFNSPHGGYVGDTDACAGCHRAHTSISSITWEDRTSPTPRTRYALLVTDASLIVDFCYACHDASAQGSETDVQNGTYLGTDFGTLNAPLNGGGFDNFDGNPVSSTHVVNGSSWGAYGGGVYAISDPASDPAVGADGQDDDGFSTGTGDLIKMDCASCHDPHGSSNYRLLKDYVYGNQVGGYLGDFTNSYDPTPTPFVTSVETGYPDGGFRLHVKYTDAGYKPNYTTPMYAKGAADPNMPGVLAAQKGMSGWCAGCHSTYNNHPSSTQYNTGSTYDANDGMGLGTRHRHPMNVALSVFKGDRALIATDNILPLAHDPGDGGEEGVPQNRYTDWIECLTCHRAHGTSAAMVGFADLNNAGIQAYAGSEVSALLRRDNRGVCEACHNK